MDYWTITRDWEGEDAFIVCGGTSVTQAAVDQLKGRHVIVVNSSYLKAPWAEMLFFADERWWTREMNERPGLIEAFKGAVASTSRRAKGDRILRLRRAKQPPGLAPAPDTVVVERSSVTAALNICLHKGARRIVLLGLDNRAADSGRIHHHPEYPWKTARPSWDIKGQQIAATAAPLAEAGVEVLNCSHISTITTWPRVTLDQALRR